MRQPKLSPQKRRAFVRLGLVLVLILLIIVSVTMAMRKTNNAASPNATFGQINPDVPVYVLLVGIDKNTPEQANFVGLAAINETKKTVDFIMLPDNTKIEGRKEKGIQDLQSVYSEGGMPLLQAVVEDVVHLPIPYYAVFTEDTFSDLIDMSGGLPMYVEENMYHADAKGKTDINIIQGYQRLTGHEAAGYMRYIDENGYIPRTLRQERLVRQFYEDRQHHFGLDNAILLYRFWHQIDSNIPAKDMASLAYSFRNVPVSNFHFYILPGEIAKDTESQDYYSTLYWTYDPVEVQKIIGTTNNSVTAAPTAGDKTANT